MHRRSEVNEMSEVYCGRSLSNAFQAIAHDLGGVRVAVQLALGPKDINPCKRYLLHLTYREHDFVNLADHPSMPEKWWKGIVQRTNDLLYEIHLTVQLPLWQYVVTDWQQLDLVTVRRVSKRVE